MKFVIRRFPKYLYYMHIILRKTWGKSKILIDLSKSHHHTNRKHAKWIRVSFPKFNQLLIRINSNLWGGAGAGWSSNVISWWHTKRRFLLIQPLTALFCLPCWKLNPRIMLYRDLITSFTYIVFLSLSSLGIIAVCCRCRLVTQLLIMQIRVFDRNLDFPSQLVLGAFFIDSNYDCETQKLFSWRDREKEEGDFGLNWVREVKMFSKNFFPFLYWIFRQRKMSEKFRFSFSETESERVRKTGVSW